jgi:hypothetical protein
LTGRKTAGGEALGMISALSNVFSPIGGMEFGKDDSNGFYDVTSVVMPSVIQPLIDLGFNRNFTGSPIYRENFTSTQYQFPDSQMYFEGVNPYIKSMTDFVNRATGGDEVIAGKIDINPEWIEHGLEQYLGGPVQFGKNFSQTVTEAVSGNNVFQDPYLRSVPFVRSFVAQTGSDFEARQNFYDNRDKALAAKDAYEAYFEKGQPEVAEKFFNENRDLIILAEQYKPFGKIIRDYTQSINEMKKMKDERFDEDIEKLIEDRTKIMREYNQLFGEAMFKPRRNPLKEILQGD